VLTGLTTIVVTGILARGNLQQIYRVQPDFVLGTMLSAAAFCFGKASTRTGTERALEVLHQIGAVAEIELAQRNASAALERLGEYYHSQAENGSFSAGVDLYQVAIDDVQNTLANLDNVIGLIHSSRPSAGHFEVQEGARQSLLDISRDLREALRRADRMRRWLSASAVADVQEKTEQTFNVLVADLLKANFAMHELCAEPLRVPPAERLITLNGYLQAAQRRAHEMSGLLEDGHVRMPDVFKIMRADLEKAATALSHTNLADAVSHEGQAI
jgi:hypothetical protein